VANRRRHLGALTPLTVAIQGYVQKDREIALESSKERHAEAISYLEHTTKPEERQRTLRFVIAMTKDDELRAWAKAERLLVDDEFKALTDQLAQAEKHVADAERLLSAAVARNAPLEQIELLKEQERRKVGLREDLRALTSVPPSVPPHTVQPFYACNTQSDCIDGAACVEHDGDNNYFCKPVCANNDDCRKYPYATSCFEVKNSAGGIDPRKICNDNISTLK
jgi:hypothetical protein